MYNQKDINKNEPLLPQIDRENKAIKAEFEATRPEVIRVNYPTKAIVLGEIYDATVAIDTSNTSIGINSGRISILEANLYEVSLSLFLSTPVAKAGDRIWIRVIQGTSNIAQVIVSPAVGSAYLTVNIPPTIVDLAIGDIKTDVGFVGFTTVNINGGTNAGASYLAVKKVGK